MNNCPACGLVPYDLTTNEANCCRAGYLVFVQGRSVEEAIREAGQGEMAYWDSYEQFEAEMMRRGESGNFTACLM